VILAASLPDCPQCGTTIRQAERIGVSAAVEPCGHFIPAEFFKPSHVESGVQHELVADGGQLEEQQCTTCGKSVDDAPYGRWLFGTCSSCAAEPAPSRWSAGMAPGTAVKWAYTPRWHIDEHLESDHHIVADGGRPRRDRREPEWQSEGGEPLPVDPNIGRKLDSDEDLVVHLFTCVTCGRRLASPPGPPSGMACGNCGGKFVCHTFEPAAYQRLRWYDDPREGGEQR
jgi:hypothetical protein